MAIQKKSTPRALPNPSPTPEGWPVLEQEALFGIAGEYVALCSPYTEADPVAVLSQLYAGFGNLVGSGPHVKLQFTTHRTNIYVAIVGDTAKARKGSSWDATNALLREVDQHWSCNKTFSGISSGEGLIAALGGTETTQAATADGRALFFESELARPLKAMARPTNVISPVLRQAWESGSLRIITRNKPLAVTGAHVSLIAHCTKDDLDANLPTLELNNGLVNRLQWYSVHRPHLLPWGAELPRVEINSIARDLKRAANFARRQGEIKFAPSARQLWIEEYPALTAEVKGVVGAATARAESQVVRLSLICALMNESKEIHCVHLLTGLALWKYAFDSARLIFGSRERSTPESRLQAKISRFLISSSDGKSRTDISEALHHHYSSAEISTALEKMRRDGEARSSLERTAGRSTERWFAIR